MATEMKVEGLTSGSPEGGHKSCSREKAVGARTKKKRRFKGETERTGRKVEMRARARVRKIHHDARTMEKEESC